MLEDIKNNSWTTKYIMSSDSAKAETVLNTLKEKDKEIKTLAQTNKSYKGMIKKKDKIIDLMAEFIFQNIDVEEEICNSAYIECKQETAQDITCINCIKQYFERKK